MRGSNNWLTIAVFATTGACEWGGGPGQSPLQTIVDASHGQVDSPIAIDAPANSDAAIDATAGTAHVLLTEITLSPTGGEFVELCNPTGAAIDLSSYFLANTGSYFTLPAATPTLPSGHFIAQFASGTSLAAGEVITIATSSAAAFDTTYGTEPTYSIMDGTMLKVAGSGSPALTDTGTAVVLFQWDGASALVKDVDIMIAGKPSATSALVDKSGYTQGGSTYANDANTISAQAKAPATGKSTKRIAAETGHETQAGTGNGITGHDETSEDTAVTWDTTFSAATPGTIPTL